MSQEVKRTLIQTLQAGCYLDDAANVAGIGYSTLLRWLQMGRAEEQGEYRDLLEAINAAKSKHIAVALARIQKAGEQARHWQANAWTISRIAPGKFAERVRVEVEEELQAFLARVKAALPPETYELIVAAGLADEGDS